MAEANNGGMSVSEHHRKEQPVSARPEVAALDMGYAEDRAQLRFGLEARGIVAYDSDLGGGLQALEVVLIPDSGREALSILAVSLDTSSEVSLAGFRTQNGRVTDCATAEPLRPETVAQAVAAVEAFWTGRSAFIRDFRAGAYDLI